LIFAVKLEILGAWFCPWADPQIMAKRKRGRKTRKICIIGQYLDENRVECAVKIQKAIILYVKLNITEYLYLA
jgi:hypothetical protein